MNQLLLARDNPGTDERIGAAAMTAYRSLVSQVQAELKITFGVAVSMSQINRVRAKLGAIPFKYGEPEWCRRRRWSCPVEEDEHVRTFWHRTWNRVYEKVVGKEVLQHNHCSKSRDSGMIGMKSSLQMSR